MDKENKNEMEKKPREQPSPQMRYCCGIKIKLGDRCSICAEFST
jgi:hypothetical protein